VGKTKGEFWFVITNLLIKLGFHLSVRVITAAGIADAYPSFKAELQRIQRSCSSGPDEPVRGRRPNGFGCAGPARIAALKEYA
jgi:hypothetical protein